MGKADWSSCVCGSPCPARWAYFYKHTCWCWKCEDKQTRRDWTAPFSSDVPNPPSILWSGIVYGRTKVPNLQWVQFHACVNGLQVVRWSVNTPDRLWHAWVLDPHHRYFILLGYSHGKAKDFDSSCCLESSYPQHYLASAVAEFTDSN